MFDIGFSEIVVCALVALVVIGPERLPETVRTVGLWIGRLKRSLRDTRAEIERQIGVDDIRRQLHNEEIMRSLEEARNNINAVIEQSQGEVNALQHEARTYTSEPDLPYHAHMDETPAGDTAKMESQPLLQEHLHTTNAAPATTTIDHPGADSTKPT